MSNYEKIKTFILDNSTETVSNSEISSRTGIKPHQQIFMITRRLMENGEIKGSRQGKEWFFCSPHKEIKITHKTSFTDNTFQKPFNTQHKQETLLFSGFSFIGTWKSSDSGIFLQGDIPKEPAVYAICLDQVIYYIGSTVTGLKKRMYHYQKPGKTQRTSIRINGLIKEHLNKNISITVIAAFPETSEWNGLQVDTITGLESGLVKTLRPAWNIRGAK